MGFKQLIRASQGIKLYNLRKSAERLQEGALNAVFVVLCAAGGWLATLAGALRLRRQNQPGQAEFVFRGGILAGLGSTW